MKANFHSLARTRNHKPDFDVSFDLTRIPVTSTFIGRKEDLEFMKKHLLRGRQSDRCQICIICGLGGIGKTQLAIEYARVHKAAYTSVFWVDGTTEDSILQSLSTVGTRLPNGQIREVDIQTLNTREGLKERAQEVLHWFAQRGNTRWLLIYDNIDKTSYGEEATDHNHEFYDIREYLPKSDSGSVIITTRLQRLGSLGNPVYLRPLSLEDGLSLLETHAGRDLKRRASTNIVDTCNWDLGQLLIVIEEVFHEFSMLTIPRCGFTGSTIGVSSFSFGNSGLLYFEDNCCQLSQTVRRIVGKTTQKSKAQRLS